MAVTVAAFVELELAGLGMGWTNVSQHVSAPDAIAISGGLRGNGPGERMAGAAMAAYTLQNYAKASLGRPVSYFSPDHANCLAGFDFGIRTRIGATRSGIVVVSSSVAAASVITTSAPHYLRDGQTVTIAGHSGSTPTINGDRVVTVLSATTFSIPVTVSVGGTGGTLSIRYVRFFGTINDIQVRASFEGVHGTYVTAVGWLEEASFFRVRGIPTQVSKRADELVSLVVASLGRQPPAIDLDVTEDVFGYALDMPADDALSEIARIVQSSFALGYEKADGTLKLENRTYRLVNNVDEDVTIDGVVGGLSNSMTDLQPNRTANRIITRVTTTAHPRTADEEFVVLADLQEHPFVPPGGFILIHQDFKDPDNPDAQVATADAQVPLTAGADYIMDTVQGAGVGPANTPFVIRPVAVGSFNPWAGNFANVSDQNDATFDTPSGGLQYQTYRMGAIAAPVNAAVDNVRLIVKIKHNAAAPYFANWYGMLFGFASSVSLQKFGDTIYTNGVSPEISIPFPSPPTGGSWTVGLINDLEAGGAFNWDNATPNLVDLRIEGMYASGVVSTDRTTSFTVATTLSGNAADHRIDNTGADGAYVQRLRVRGRRLFDQDAVERVAEDTPANMIIKGERPLDFDMPYQGDSDIAQQVADYILSLYKDKQTYIDTVRVNGNESDERMAAVLSLDISNLVRVRETISGLDRKYFINGVSLEMRQNLMVDATWLLAPADPIAYWLLGVVGRSELGVTTYLGPI